MVFRVAALFRYPLKSAAGEQCESLRLDRLGVEGDRRWMVTTPTGSPITQREVPALAFIRTHLSEDGLLLSWKSRETSTVCVKRPGPDAADLNVTIWGDTVSLRLADHEATEWLSDRLGQDARLAFMSDETERSVNPRYGKPDDRTALTDGYPLHLIGSGSMADLNSRLDVPVHVNRFRPNIYVECPEAFAEDQWQRVRIGNCGFRVVKPCPRCSVTTVDPDTANRDKEPLLTLSRYRKRDGGVMFGQNVIHDGPGEIKLGDHVEVVSRRDAPVA